jgi:hypothetical protein
VRVAWLAMRTEIGHLPRVIFMKVRARNMP